MADVNKRSKSALPEKKRQQVTAEPLLIPDITAAALAGVSRATWWRLHVAGKTPASLKLARRRLWNRAEVVAWIEARCPDRQTWEALRAMSRRNRVEPSPRSLAAGDCERQRR